MTRKIALVTGGARRLGRAIAGHLASNGFDVAIHFHGSREEAEDAAAACRSEGARADLFEADLTDGDETARLVEQVAAEFGMPDLLVNNASIFEEDSLADFTWDRFDRHFAIHVKAPLELARSFARHLPAGSEGLVVNMIDQRVWKPTPRFFTYTLSKSALWDATRTMAQALAPRIRVNAIGPGPTLRGERQDDRDFQAQQEAVLLRRGPDLDEFGRAILYLWGARSVTGQMIALDGGQHLAWETPDVTGIRE